jgi:hypothetical protein
MQEKKGIVLHRGIMSHILMISLIIVLKIPYIDAFIFINSRHMANGDMTRQLVNDASNQYNRESGDDFFDFEYVAGVVKQKKRNGSFKVRDNRESMPFEVYIDAKMGQKKPHVGTYLLDAQCSCGDLIVLDEGTFSVKRVSYVYKWMRTQFHVIKKRIDVEEVPASQDKLFGGRLPNNVLQ